MLVTRVVVGSSPDLRYFEFTYFMIFHSDFFICEGCESIPSDSDTKNDDHKWWHSLLVLRKSLIELEPTSNKVEATGTQAGTQSAAADPDFLLTDDNNTTNQHSTLISGVITRISVVEDKFNVALTAIEDKVNSTKGELSSIEERVVKVNDIETKLDNMEKKLDDIEKKVVKLDDIEERVVKLDDKFTELTKMLGDLIGRLNI